MAKIKRETVEKVIDLLYEANASIREEIKAGKDYAIADLRDIQVDYIIKHWN